MNREGLDLDLVFTSSLKKNGRHSGNTYTPSTERGRSIDHSLKREEIVVRSSWRQFLLLDWKEHGRTLEKEENLDRKKKAHL